MRLQDERHFLCLACLCECVKNECAVGGRFERELPASDAAAAGSAAGELPCLMFPSVRAVAHHRLVLGNDSLRARSAPRLVVG